MGVSEKNKQLRQWCYSIIKIEALLFYIVKHISVAEHELLTVRLKTGAGIGIEGRGCDDSIYLTDNGGAGLEYRGEAFAGVAWRGGVVIAYFFYDEEECAEGLA